MWFSMIARVALKVLQGAPANDVRSDDEDDELEDETEIDEKSSPSFHRVVGEVEQPYEEEVGVESINFKGRTSNASRYKKSTSATGVSLPGHSDRKELLGRIGCDHKGD
jgi:acyl-CoA-dependent ceramide synthase